MKGKYAPDISRLCSAMQKARLVLRRFRQQRTDAVRLFVGHHWSEQSSPDKRHVNLISMYVGVMTRALIPRQPRVMLSTFDSTIRPTVATAESWANKEIENIRLKLTLERVVTDALFSIGICKVALAAPADSAKLAFRLPAGRPYAERVDLDDFVFDIHARDFKEAGYIGHRYRVPLDVIKDSRLYSKARKQLEPSEDKTFNETGDTRISTLGRGWYSNEEEFEDFVDLWEVYLPRHRVVLTLADSQLGGAEGGGGDEPLREQKWLGPDDGPYHILGYGVVPGNAMPTAPVQNLVDLDEAANHIYRKLIRQAQRQKEVVFVAGGADEDGNRLINANDGDCTKIDNPDMLKAVNWGGPFQANLALFADIYDKFNRQAGNLELIGGMAPQSKTLGQDRMLDENASNQVTAMQEQTIDYSAQVVRALLWYWWHDPQRVMHTTFQIPGMPQLKIPRRATPQERQRAMFKDLDIAIDPYSMQYQTPQQRLQLLNTTLQNLAPYAGIFQQQGITLDARVWLQKIARYADLPDLPEILTQTDPPQQNPQPPSTEGAGAGMPAQTTRTYNRVSNGGASRYGQDLGRINALRSGQTNGQPNGQPQVR